MSESSVFITHKVHDSMRSILQNIEALTQKMMDQYDKFEKESPQLILPIKDLIDKLVTLQDKVQITDSMEMDEVKKTGESCHEITLLLCTLEEKAPQIIQNDMFTEYHKLITILFKIYMSMKNKSDDVDNAEYSVEDNENDLQILDLLQNTAYIHQNLMYLQQMTERGILFDDSYDHAENYYQLLSENKNKMNALVHTLEDEAGIQEDIDLCLHLAKQILQAEVNAFKTAAEHASLATHESKMLHNMKSTRVTANLPDDALWKLHRLEKGQKIINNHISKLLHMSNSEDDHEDAAKFIESMRRTLVITAIECLPSVLNKINKQNSSAKATFDHLIKIICNETSPEGQKHLKSVLQNEFPKLKHFLNNEFIKLKKGETNDEKIWKALAIHEAINQINKSLGIQTKKPVQQQSDLDNKSRNDQKQSPHH